MTEWLDVCPAGALAPGDFDVVETDDNPIAVFNVDGDLLAIEDICTHDGEELTGGPIDGDEIICPRHGARFCLRTGAALTPPAYDDVQTFEVRIEAGRIQVRDDRDDP
ncbi:MAG: non-heme iron oxygenase ferredoxin subunit [Gammaproteobacteria bacterium]|nr:non-heme iron oxygenase ferredoxin subunit [Gammaproteobacteria bacterium]